MEDEKVEVREDIEVKKVMRILKVLFTVKQRLEMGEQMANAIRNTKQAQDEAKSVKAQYDGKIKQFDAEISNISERLNSGWEMKPVDCEETRDYRTGSAIVRRVDTQEIIEERALTWEERQMPLFPGKEIWPTNSEEKGGGDEGVAEAGD
jgi:hypothetical protein